MNCRWSIIMSAAFQMTAEPTHGSADPAAPSRLRRGPTVDRCQFEVEVQVGWEPDIIWVINGIWEIIFIQKGGYTPLLAQPASLEFEVPDIVYPCKRLTGLNNASDARTHGRYPQHGTV